MYTENLDLNLKIEEDLALVLSTSLSDYFKKKDSIDVIHKLERWEYNLDSLENHHNDLLKKYIVSKNNLDDFIQLEILMTENKKSIGKDIYKESLDCITKKYINRLNEDRIELKKFSKDASKISTNFHEHRERYKDLVMILRSKYLSEMEDYEDKNNQDLYFELTNYIVKKEIYLKSSSEKFKGFDKLLYDLTNYLEQNVNTKVEAHKSLLNDPIDLKLELINSTTQMDPIAKLRTKVKSTKLKLYLASPLIGFSSIAYILSVVGLSNMLNVDISAALFINCISILSIISFIILTNAHLSNPFRIANFSSLIIYSILFVKFPIFADLVTTDLSSFIVLSTLILVSLFGYCNLWKFENENEILKLLQKTQKNL